MLDDTKEVRDYLIRSGAEDYAKWMAKCHCAYLNNKSVLDDKIKDFLKEGERIIKSNIKTQRLKTADDIYGYIEDMRSRIHELEKRLNF